jgi:O-antigen ligase
MMGKQINRYRNFLIEIGGHMVAVFLPLYLNPYAHQSIELDKFQFFLWITLGMLLVALAAFVLEMGEKKNRSDIWQISLNKIKLLRENNPLLTPVLVYAAVYIMAAVFSIDPASSWWGLNSAQGTATVMCCILFFILLVSAIQEKKQIDRLVTSIIIGSVPVAIYGWVQFMGYDPLDWVSGSISHVHATLGYSLFLGSYLVLIIPFTFGRLIAGWRGLHYSIWGYGIILFLQISCLLFTLARGAWLGITLGILLLVLLLAYRWQRRKLVLVSVIILIAGGVMFFMLNIGLASSSSTSFEWLSTSRIVEARAISNNERLVLWRQTLPIVASRPWLGYGPETFSSAFWRTYPDGTETILRSIDPWDPHNWFLYHLIGTGVLGFLVFVWLQVRFFFVTIASFQRFESIEMQIISAAVVGAGAAYLIQTQFNPIAIAPAAIYWLVIALGTALSSDRISPP